MTPNSATPTDENFGEADAEDGDDQPPPAGPRLADARILSSNPFPRPEDVGPASPVPCENCNQEIQRLALTVEPAGEVLRLHACACRLWAEWLGAGNDACPVCQLLGHGDRELVHTHGGSDVLETHRPGEDVDGDGDRWGREGSALPHMLADHADDTTEEIP